MAGYVRRSLLPISLLVMAFIAVSLMLAGCPRPPVPPPDPTPTPDTTDYVLKFTAVTDGNSTSGKYCFWKINTDSYEFKTGDTIEYDVLIENNISGLGGIEIYTTTPGIWFRGLGWADQNGKSGHPGTDISTYAYGHGSEWYHRILPVPAGAIGLTSLDVDLAVEHSSVSETYVAYYDNIVVKNGGEIKHTFYGAGSTPVLDSSQIRVANGYSTTLSSVVEVDKATVPIIVIEPSPTPTVDPEVTPTPTPTPTLTPSPTPTPSPSPTPFPGSPSGDVLKFTAVTDATAGTGKHFFWKINTDQYTFQAGDTIEYDVYLDTNIGGLGGIEIYTMSVNPLDTFRGQAGWADQCGIGGHPNKNLTTRAYQQWYHRVLPVPATMIGIISRDFDLAVEHSGVSETYVAYYDNIVIKNNGSVVKTVYADGQPSVNAARGGAGFDATLTKVEVVPVP
ncbi:MAG: hypothetical protein ACM3ZC_05025 [Bacteroidota bacterium]